MERFNKTLKNILFFLIIFLIVNYFLNSFKSKDEVTNQSQNTIIFTTTETQYSRRDIVTVQIKNDTKENIILPNRCPREPFDVYRFENNAWILKTVSPALDCANSVSIVLKPAQGTKIAFKNWNHAIFSDTGRFKIDFKTRLKDGEHTFTTNEFVVVKENILKQLWDGIFYRPIYNALIFLTYIAPFHSLAFAIIILTIIIRTILLVPSHKSMKSQKKLQEIQPRLEKIKEKYKGDQQKIASETMAIWKEAKVNPLGSCLPMLLQLPFLIAIFYVIQDGLNPDNTYLLYSAYQNFSLNNIGTNFFGILELKKANLYVMPLIIGGLQFAQIKLSMASSNKKTTSSGKDQIAMTNGVMLYMMPVMIAVFTASLPAGVGMYWGTSTIYGIIQQIFINRSKPDKEGESKVRVIEVKT